MCTLTYTQGVRKTFSKGHIPWCSDLILPAEKQ